MEDAWDGRISVEHQIAIHVNDLLQFGSVGTEVREILIGLQYVINYRIRGRKGCVLDLALCDQLVRALLLFTGERSKGRGLFRRNDQFSGNAECAFVLLTDFCVQVQACRDAICSIDVEELRCRLCFYQRITKPNDPVIFSATISLLKILNRGSSWQEFVEDDKIDQVADTLQFTRFYAEEVPETTDTSFNAFPPSLLYFDRDAKRVIDMFRTSEVTGLREEAISILTDHFGSNVIPSADEKSKWRMFLSQLKDLMILILLATTIISVIMDYPQIESAVILGVVVIMNICVGFWQELKSSQTIAAMKSLRIPSARVKRNGDENMVSSIKLVPGDIVLLREGDCVPADLRLIKCSRLEVQETILTGEVISISKNPKAIRIASRKLPISQCSGNAFMGTMVTRGSGVGVVVRTGANTEIGKIGAALTLSSMNDLPSTLKVRLTRLGQILVILSIVLCAAVALIGLFNGESVEKMARLAISLAVSVIPEGLVAILTVAIALAIRRLAKNNALARRVSVVETLGAVSVAAADKTGTLTEGKMRLERVWLPNMKEDLQVESVSDINSIADALRICVLCNNASIEGLGEPMEAALMTGAISRGFDAIGVLSTCSQILEIPFDSERKMKSVVIQTSSGHNICSKGAAEAILPLCSQYQLITGDSPSPITEEILNYIAATVDRLASEGLRVIALAKRTNCTFDLIMKAINAAENSHNDFDDICREIEKNLTFVGLACLYDPPRKGVADSVALCHRAGIKVCMITGDHAKTATAIARQIGIYDPTDPEKSRIIRGRDLDMLSVDTLATLCPFPTVFARVSPQNKLMIVKSLQKRREIVAMTGDGVNDAPAIRQAEVGVAMGKSGAEITRDAASLILLDDDFSVLVMAIAQGRQMFRNISLFIIYLLSCNSAEILTMIIAMTIGWPALLTPLNILWANIIADIPPSMCLALERVDPETLMNDTPKEVVLRVMGRDTWILVFVNGIVLSAITLMGYGTSSSPSAEIKRSEAFLLLIGLQIVLALFSRSARQSFFIAGLFSNLWLIVSVFLSFGLLLMGLYIPFLYNILDLAPVNSFTWIKFGTGSMVLILCNEITKLALRHTS